MMPEQQQRILGYFIEEAKDHLNTIEQGLLNLQATIQDPDMVSEVFRAAHSVKGGAAMLSLGSIQQTSHRLEDYFKVLKETPTTQVDRNLETMFLQVFDGLQALLEELQGPFGLTEEKAQEVMADVEPVFGELESHLNELVAAAPAVAPEAPKVAATPATASPLVGATSSEDSALKLVFSSDVPGQLREMLTLFKQTDTEASRAALQSCCEALKRVGEQFDLSRWCDLTAAARQAVGNPEQTYRSLAPVVIKELKRAQEQVLSGQAAAITVSAELESLMPMPVEADAAVDDIDSLLDDALATTDESDLTDLFDAESESATDADADLDWLDTSTDLDTADGEDELTDSLSALTDDPPPTTAPLREPTVGAAELNSLADLFEGEVSELDSPWEEISENEAAIADTPGPDIELDSDFSDLLDGSLDDEDTTNGSGDLADLFGDTDALAGEQSSTDAGASPSDTSDNDLDDLLNLTDSAVESPEADPADTSDEGLDALLDGFDSEENDVAATDDFNLDDAVSETATPDDDLDFDLDAPAADDLDLAESDELDFDLNAPAADDLDFAESTAETPAEDDFGGLFDADESAEATLDDASASDAPAATAPAAEAESPDSLGAIADPWSFEEAEEEAEDDASALDALDELWTEPEAPAAEATDDGELDFSDFPEPAEEGDVTAAAEPMELDELSGAEAESTNDDFGDLFADDGDDDLDLGETETTTDLAEDDFELGDITTDEPSVEAPASDFDALLDDADADEAEAATTDDFGGLFDEDSEATAETDFDFADEGGSVAAADTDELADLDLAGETEDVDGLFDESDATPADDEMAGLFSEDDDLGDDSGLFETATAATEADDLGLEDSIDEAAESPVEDDLELGETGDTADLDLTFADDGDEALALEAEDDQEAEPIAAESESATDAADLFADDGDESSPEAAIAATDTDDFFNTEEVSPAVSANAADISDDIDDFFSTPEPAVPAPAPVDELADATAPAEPVETEEPESATTDLDWIADEASGTDADADLDLDFAADETADTTSEAGYADFDFDAPAEDAEAGDADLDLDFAAAETADAATEAGDVDFDFDAPAEAEDAEAGDADLDLDFAAAETADTATEASAADLDLDFAAEDADADATDLDFDFATADGDAAKVEGEADLDLDFAATETADAAADAGDADLDFDFPTEDAEAATADLDFDFATTDDDAGTAELDFDLPDTEAAASDADLDLDFADDADGEDATEAGLGEDLDLFGDETADEAGAADLDFADTDMSLTSAEGNGFDTGELDGELDSLLDGADEAVAANGVVAESPLTDQDSADEGLSDLDLDFSDADEGAAIAESAEDAPEAAAFDDLDALLDEPPATEATADVTEPSAPPADDFDELDSLLGDESSEDSNAAVDEGGVDFDELDALIGDDNAAPAAPPIAKTDDNGLGDDFGDLEKLLEEADQTLGGSSSSIRSAGPGRSSRRVGGIVDQTMRVSVKHLDNLNNLVGELVVNRNSLEQDQDRFRQFLDNLLFQVQQLNDVGQRMRDLYERSLLESSLLASRQAFQTGGTRVTQTAGGNGDGHATGASFDALEMDRFTGFHTLTQEMIELIVRVRESSSDIAYTVESTDQIARQFRQVTTQLQEGLNKARMVPFAQTADRLPRAVRDISIKCGKEARLVVEGRDTLIDKMLLERLYDPMTHLVNNAITHGIEPPEERAAIGKPREGKINVRAFYQGNQTVIYIEDDGAGINADVIRRKAIQRGLITQAEADSMNTLETYELLFRHGFSTRDQADDFAGRGVGMDVVRTALSEIRGSITIDSELGKGTSFTIRLPLTLSISKALSCLNNQARIAFPMDGVEDMFDVPRDRVQTDDEGQSYIQWRDMSLTFQPLSELLQFNRALGRGRVYGGSQDDDMVSIVVLRNANTYIGIQVDRVLGEQEIVIKQIEGPVPKPMGIAGATVLGDGRVMPIGDVLELIDIAQGRVRREAGSSLWSQVELPPEEDEEPVKADPTVLIVDDSITVRELLSMSFNKVGYRVEQARDGQEAWEKMRSGLPCDLVFCDIEMPRMDGLELLSRMQKDSMLKNIPIAMLTSRGADRHRQMAVDLGASGYFTKPYLEEALLEAAQRMLKGEMLINQVAEEAE